MLNRRQFLAAASVAPAAAATAAPRARPNIIVIITDDQGYGDLSLHGNRDLATPHMDSLANQGAQFTQFQVCPVCAPTRAGLLTGRYNYRTGVVDTYLGRALMDTKEVTIAETLRAAGYRTAIFGKWHLGDNYPLRPGDQGFDEALVINGGGLAQPGDPPPGQSYFNPVLRRNGKYEKAQGYCTDIFFRETMQFIEKNKTKPFFIYLPTNAPHTPLQIEEKYSQPYKAKGLDDVTAKIYGMLQNVDENVGKLQEQLTRLQLRDNTIVVFLSDNGPQQPRFNGGMRGLKTTVYQGGIRVPCFLQWPARVKPGLTIDRIASHLDLLPTLIAAAGVPLPKVPLDGRSLLPLLEGKSAGWKDRSIHTQWHRGDTPELFRSHAVRTQRWKLVNGVELYDMDADPAEANNVAARHPDVVARLRGETEAWFRSVAASRGGYAPPRLAIGYPGENPTLLTRQDWRGPRASWEAKGIGYWEVEVLRAASYDVDLLFAPAAAAGTAVFKLGSLEQSAAFAAGARTVRFSGLRLPVGPGRLEPVLRINGEELGVQYVEIKQVT
ncbi:MAG: arylsulfatase [Acidobacteria bacterium]|nr:arylsulfatase [Acidobacteriota bacterium]